MTHKLLTLFGAATVLTATPALAQEVEVEFRVPSEGLMAKGSLDLSDMMEPAILELDAADGSHYRLEVSVDEDPNKAHAAIYHIKDGLFGKSREILVDEHTLTIKDGEATRVQVSSTWGIRDSATFQVGLYPDGDSAFAGR